LELRFFFRYFRVLCGSAVKSLTGQATAETAGFRREVFRASYWRVFQQQPARVCRENRNSPKTGNQKSFVAIEKLVTRQMCAKKFLTISPNLFFRQTRQG
jgi:hypothetical protein